MTDITSVQQFLRSLSVSEEGGDTFSEAAEKELDLAKAVDAMTSSMEKTLDNVSKQEKREEYEHECREKLSVADMQSRSEVENTTNIENYQEKSKKPSSIEQAHLESVGGVDEKPVEEASALEYSRKLTVLYQLFSACLAQTPEESKKYTRRRRGYDARHRVALRLLATWFDIKWIKVVSSCIYIICNFCNVLVQSCIFSLLSVLELFLLTTGYPIPYMRDVRQEESKCSTFY